MRQVILILSVMFTVFSQTLMKIGGQSAKIEGSGILAIIFSYIKSPFIILAFGFAGVGAFLYTYALTELDFNYASFVSSLSYVFVIVISLFIFKEHISPVRWAGCGLIMVGILMVLRS